MCAWTSNPGPRSRGPKPNQGIPLTAGPDSALGIPSHYPITSRRLAVYPRPRCPTSDGECGAARALLRDGVHEHHAVLPAEAEFVRIPEWETIR